MARLKGLEPLTYWFVASHSIQLSYRRISDCSDAKHILAQQAGKIKPFFNLFAKKNKALFLCFPPYEAACP